MGTLIPAIALTTGEPAGIGPDVVLDVLDLPRREHLIVVGDRRVLEDRAHRLARPCPHLPLYRPEALRDSSRPGTWLLHVPTQVPVEPGRLDVRNADYVLRVLDAACQGLSTGTFSALVTAPVHKGILNVGGHRFSGHTEYLARRFSVPRTVMLFVDGDWRVALLTTHLPLADVAKTITPDLLEEVLRILHQGLDRYYALRQPRIAVAGINPHAGEGGVLGEEEERILKPTLERLRQRHGWRLSGPLPADTLFLPQVIRNHDAVLGMYHDQVLPVVKYRGFATAVNVTLGLPFPRTSVDHGTALELAGHGQASAESLKSALVHASDILAALKRDASAAT